MPDRARYSHSRAIITPSVAVSAFAVIPCQRRRAVDQNKVISCLTASRARLSRVSRCPDMPFDFSGVQIYLCRQQVKVGQYLALDHLSTETLSLTRSS